VLDHLLGGLALLGGVEEPVGVDALVPVLQNRVSEDVVDAAVTVLPDQRNLLLVHVLESTTHDGSTVGALEASLGGPAAEIGFHFDCSFLLRLVGLG
jgi:hypothetical protein